MTRMISGSAVLDQRRRTTRPIKQLVRAMAICGLATVCSVIPVFTVAPSYVDITWFSISNLYYQVGPLNIVTDGYITRIPASAFFGGGGGLAWTHQPYKPDVSAVARVLTALGGPSKVNLLLTGHSHFDHSFDTATWAKLTKANIIGSKTTCLQAEAENVRAARCRAVYGREAIKLAGGVTMRVVRWNHSGDPAQNPEQHDPVELQRVPLADAATGGLHAGVAEDFPNGGGNRGYLFTIDGPQGRVSWFFQNSASPVDLRTPIVIDGVDYGAPLANLKLAMKDARLDSVDLWIGTGGRAIAELVLPILKPKFYLPVHWDGLYEPFFAGMPHAYEDRALEDLLIAQRVTLVKPRQYMDKWRLDRTGMRAVENSAVKRALGFADVQAFGKR
jgi:L-ascorbate metabolism protein UlaG (beta-lactamase superfamily)